MNNFKHTPGPWEVVPGDDYMISAAAYPADFPHLCKADDTGDMLAYVGNRTADFGEANARLIAAAPDLLEALESVLGNCLDSEGLAAAHAKARAAIAKATGESA
jgi:hypothetical protein